MRRIAISLVLLFGACAGDSDVQVLRAWSNDGTAHYDLSIDGVARHVARTPQPDGATVVVSDADGDLAGVAELEDAEAFVLASDAEVPMSEMPEDLDDASAHALELAIAGELPEVEVARLDDYPDTMPLTCSGQCAANRDACSAGANSGVVVALCNWIYSKCLENCNTWGGVSSGGVWIP